MIKFSDGMTFDTSGPMRIVSKRDGLYVVGNNWLIPIETREEGEKIIDKERAKIITRVADAVRAHERNNK
jgi:hypothetical protein